LFVLRWLFLSAPALRIVLLGMVCSLLLFFYWLPDDIKEIGSWISFGYLQSIAAAFLSASVILLMAMPTYALKENKTTITDYVHISKWIWPHRILTIAVLIYGHLTFSNVHETEGKIIFGLSILQFLLYSTNISLMFQNLNIMRYVEAGIILIVAAGFGIILSLYFVLISGKVNDPFDDKGLQFLFIFCAFIMATYEIYLNRKLNRLAQELSKS
jgi:hypothetical protein